MSAIQSDITGASDKATALKNATTNLSQSAVVTLDTQTTVSGNTSAQEVIQNVQNTTQKIVSAVHTASNNLNSVATAFAAKDEEISKTFLQPLDLANGDK